MVESTQNQEGDPEGGEDKTFLEQPDILDKIKAAALITDGMCDLYVIAYPCFLSFSRSRKSSRACVARSRHLHDLPDS